MQGIKTAGIDDRALHEECGVFGIYGVENAASFIYYGLHSLQHRGQEGCGIVTVDGEGTFHSDRGLGLVSEVFSRDSLQKQDGMMGIGHVRYSTYGGGGIDNVQPFYFHHKNGDFALAHNGNIVNAPELSSMLEDKGCLFRTTSDSEILAHLIRKPKNGQRITNIISALQQMEGAFSFLIMTKNRIYACRDRNGLRPLSIGTLAGGYVVSSETCAFDIVGAKFLRDVEPGEIVCIDRHGLRSNFYTQDRCTRMCAMEYIYFARPDSKICGCNVHSFRKESGRLLYEQAPTVGDIVVGVPDSSLSAAMGYSEKSGIPLETGLVKSRYIGRTFIQPTQSLREMGVKMKLSAIREVVEGKDIILLDDSIVRGTTSRRIVRMLRDAGAKSVHVRIASPPLTSPCFYGIDISDYDQLISANMTTEQVCKAIEADSLVFLSEENTLKSARGVEGLCLACFSGDYPTDTFSHMVRKKCEQK